MALIGTVVVIVLLVAPRLSMLLNPGFPGLMRAFGRRTTLLLSSLALAGAAVLIVLSRH